MQSLQNQLLTSTQCVSGAAAILCSKVLPPHESLEKERTEKMQRFKINALKLLSKINRQEKPLNVVVTPEQKRLLKEINQELKNLNYVPPPGVKIMQGGYHHVLFLDSLPDFVFKPISKEKKDKYIQFTQKARQIIAEDHLHILEVPRAEIIEIDSLYFVIQERADILFFDGIGLIALYAYCWEDEELRVYMELLFTQMTIFICKFCLLDVKYDNIPLTKEGRVALIDLDCGSPVWGLTRGESSIGKPQGLFSYIPLEYLDQFQKLALQHLHTDLHEKFITQMGHVRAKAEKRFNNEKKYALFWRNLSLVSPIQGINLSDQKLFTDPKMEEFSRYAVQSANEILFQSKSFSLRIGRKIGLVFVKESPLAKKAEQLWGASFSIQEMLDQTLEKLTQEGYIYKHKFYPLDRFPFPLVKICC